MNDKEIKRDINRVANNLALKWGNQPIAIDYLMDGTRVTYVRDEGLTHIYLMIVKFITPYCSKVTVQDIYIRENTSEHLENMINYCFFNTDFLKLRGVTGD